MKHFRGTSDHILAMGETLAPILYYIDMYMWLENRIIDNEKTIHYTFYKDKNQKKDYY